MSETNPAPIIAPAPAPATATENIASHSEGGKRSKNGKKHGGYASGSGSGSVKKSLFGIGGKKSKKNGGSAKLFGGRKRRATRGKGRGKK